MSKRLTAKEIKHDIREDEVRTVLGRVFQTLAERPGLVLGAIAGIFGVAIVIAGLFAVLESRRQAAGSKLAAAIETYGEAAAEEGAESDEPGASGDAKEAFEEIRGSFGAGAAGDVASLYLADIALAEGDAEGARKIWEEFLAKHQDHILALSVRLNLIHLDRDSGRAAEVATALQAELADPEKTLPEDVILFELAQTREALGESEAAVELYQRILDEHPLSPYAARARQMTTSAGT
jgi:tetratricopeptide (TPR) repeat protein